MFVSFLFLIILRPRLLYRIPINHDPLEIMNMVLPDLITMCLMMASLGLKGPDFLKDQAESMSIYIRLKMGKGPYK